MSDKIPQQVLSEVLRDAIGNRRVKVAVFLTFQFDPGFFEEEILPLLFEQSFSHIPKLRLLQLEEAMIRNVDEMAVYYDRWALTANGQPARLDYRRVGLARSTGYFHPKNILLLLENREDEATRDSLLAATLSANLTRSGWWENVEVAHLEEVHDGEKCSFRGDLLDLISRVKQEDQTGETHAALELLHKFLHYRVDDVVHQTKEGRWKPRLYTGNGTVADFLANFIEPTAYNLEIISPYFDDSGAATTLRKLRDVLEPKEVRVFLPQGKDGAALCQKNFFEAVEGLGRVKWGKLPPTILRPSSAEKSAEAQRFVHAKVYRFWNQEREFFFIGSVNLTGAAHSSGRAGNFETGILVEPERPDTPRLTWWLSPLAEDRPGDFRVEASDDAAPDAYVGALSLRFDWATGSLEYFWEQPGGERPHTALVMAQGVAKFSIEPIRFGNWIALPAAAGELKELLKSTSFVDVSVDGGEPFRVLVREEGMAHKPSILLSLTAEEILQYWSLLSPEQREAFLTAKVPSLAEGTELMTLKVKARSIESMFDRFAGIFHAFSRLGEHIKEALDAGRETEAIYRLFGEKYDSLPALIAKVINDENGDRVNRYVTLLCARQLLKKVETTYSEFAQNHHGEFRRVRRQLEACERIREEFTFDSPEVREQFFDWFERMFFLEISLPTEEAV